MRTLTFQPLIPPAFWVFLALGTLALWGWYGWRRPLAIRPARWACALGLTLSGTAGVLAILLNPTWLERLSPPGGKPLLTVLVDSSASMATADAGAGQRRFDSARALARSYADELGGEFDVRVVAFAGSSRPVTPEALARTEPNGPSTDVAAAIGEGLGEGRPQGQAIVLLSDGSHNAGGQAAHVLDAVRIARGIDVPVFTKTLGGAAGVRDLSLSLVSRQELAFLDEPAALVARVRRRGLAVPQAWVTVTADGRAIARQAVTFDTEGWGETRFQVRQPQRGLYRYEARVESAPGESIFVNNAETFVLQVVDEPIRVLLLEGKPYWDAKFLMRTLAADPAIELESVVRVADGRFLRRALKRSKAADGASPATVGKLDEWKVLESADEAPTGPSALRRFQIVVLGRDADVFLGPAPLGNLRAWLAGDGGALVCYRGAPAAQLSQPLARLLPVAWSRAPESRFRVQLTAPGQAIGWLPAAGDAPRSGSLADLPTLARAERPQEPKPLAVVLATAAEGPEAVPVVSYQPYGSGRVVVIEGAGMWRWAFRPPQQRTKDEVYGGLWHSLMRWLASGTGLPPGQDLALRSDSVTFENSEPVTASLLLRRDSTRSEVPQVELTGGGLTGSKSFTPVPAGEEPGVYRVLFGPLPQGHYQARVAGRDTAWSRIAFDVREFVEEQLDIAARPDLMARIAEGSGAAVLDDASPRALAAQFHKYQARSRTERVVRYPAWDRWWVLAGVVLAWASAWTLRRSSGLV